MCEKKITKKIFFAVIAASVTFISFIPLPVKKLIGNWVSLKDISFTGPGDILDFEKKKYSYELYASGKFPSGIEFKADSTFAEYHSISGSEEPDEVFYHDEHYLFTSDSTVEVKGYSRNFRFKVLELTSKKLSIKILP